MQIRNITQMIFSPKTEKIGKTISSNTSTNPFAMGINKNIITADVFEKSQKALVGEGIMQKASALMNKVSDKISSFGDSIHAGFNSGLNRVTKFATDLKETGKDFVGYLRDSKLTFNLSDKKNLIKLDMANMSYGVNNLKKRPVTELKTELTELLAKKGA